MSSIIEQAVAEEIVAALERDPVRIGYTVKSAARALDVSEHTILMAIKRGKLGPPHQCGPYSILTREQLIDYWQRCPLPHDRKPRT